MNNHIKVGDILILSLISFLEFEVIIGRAPVEVHPDDDNDDNKDEDNMDIVDEDDDKSSAKWFRNTSPWWNADQAPDSCRVCKQAPPCPRFLMTIRPSSHPWDLSLVNHFPLTSLGTQQEVALAYPCPQAMAVPRRFWDLHGNMLTGNDLQLKGPNKAICMVKAKRTYD